MIQSSRIFYGLTFQHTRNIAFKYAKQLKNIYSKNWVVDEMAGVDWMYGFLKKNQELNQRKPENTSLARASAFNRQTVGEFQRNIYEVMKKHSFSADLTWMKLVLQQF